MAALVGRTTTTLRLTDALGRSLRTRDGCCGDEGCWTGAAAARSNLSGAGAPAPRRVNTQNLIFFLPKASLVALGHFCRMSNEPLFPHIHCSSSKHFPRLNASSLLLLLLLGPWSIRTNQFWMRAKEEEENFLYRLQTSYLPPLPLSFLRFLFTGDQLRKWPLVPLLLLLTPLSQIFFLLSFAFVKSEEKDYSHYCSVGGILRKLQPLLSRIVFFSYFHFFN